MSTVRRLLLTALPKVLLSKFCGWWAARPLPRSFRRRFYTWFARRYDADLDQVDGEIRSFRSLQAFFRRSLLPDARPLATSDVVMPCDGRIVTAGQIDGQRIPQVKGQDYRLADLLADSDLADQLAGGQQVTIYLAPGDYHRVHTPFDCTVQSVDAIAGTLFPVNPAAVRCIDQLFVRNSRHVFHLKGADGQTAALVMVGAFNVGYTSVTIATGNARKGQELGQFGFGSTVVLVLDRHHPPLRELAGETKVQMGENLLAEASTAADASTPR